MFANFWRARSRLYQKEILQENNSKYAFASIFQALQDLHTFAPLQSQKISQKIGLKKSNFRENSANILHINFLQQLQNFC